jgi:hypothetical protein
MRRLKSLLAAGISYEAVCII